MLIASLSMDKALTMTKGQTWSPLFTKTFSMQWIPSSRRCLLWMSAFLIP